jgi:hypothetical protein
VEVSFDGTELRAEGQEVLDMVGTGGDRQSTFNISTAAALLAAAVGVRAGATGPGVPIKSEVMTLPHFHVTMAITSMSTKVLTGLSQRGHNAMHDHAGSIWHSLGAA